MCVCVYNFVIFFYYIRDKQLNMRRLLLSRKFLLFFNRNGILVISLVMILYDIRGKID